MDWQDRLRRNRQRIRDEEEDRWAGFSSALNRTPAAGNPDDDEPGFLGAISGIGKGIYDIGKGAVDIVGGAIEDISQSAGQAIGGISDVVKGEIKSNELGSNTEELNRINKQRSEYMAKLKDEDFDRPEVKDTLAEMNRRAQEIASRGESISNSEEIKKSQAVDTTKTAAAAADTFLNVATAGGAGALKNVGFSAGKQALRHFGREALETAGKKAVTSPRRALLQDVTEGALVGGAQGGLSEVRENGADFDMGEMFKSALTGSALSAGLSGGAKIALDPAVRREIPGMLQAGRDYIGDTAAFARNMPRAQREGGYMSLDGSGPPELIETPFDRPEVPTDPTPLADRIASEDLPTNININTLPAARRAKLQEQLDTGEVDLKLFRPQEKQLIRSEIDNVIAQNDQSLAAHLMSDPSAIGTNRAGGEFTMPILTKDEIGRYFGKDKSAWPLKYTAKKDTARGGVDQQALENGFDDVDEYLQRAREIMDSKVTDKGIKRALQEARKNPQYVQQAIKNLVVDEPLLPAGTSALTGRAAIAPGLPKGAIRGQEPLQGMAPENGDLQPVFNSNADVQASLGRLESETNPWVDAVAGRPGANAPGVQQPLDMPATPYGEQDLTRLALPAGETPPTPNLSKSQVKTAAAAGNLPEDFTIGAKGPSKNAIQLPSESAMLADTATRTTPKGKVTPLMNGPEGVSQDILDAVRELKQLNDETGVFKKIAPTKDLNTINEDITRAIGGVTSKPGQMIEKIRARIQGAGAETVRFNNTVRTEAEEAFKRYNFTGDQWKDINKWLNHQAPDQAAARQASLDEISKKYGPEVQARALQMFDEWSPKMRQAFEAYNADMARLGQDDKIIGDLGPNFWPRVYAQQSLKDKATDITRSIIDTKQTGLGKSGFNPNTFSGSTTQSNMTLGGDARMFNQAPIGSEFSTPTAAFTGHQKSRTAKSPVQEQVNPLEAAAKYLESVNTARANTTAVFDIRGVQKAIKTVQEETGDNSVTILHDVLNNSANALLGKTNEFDRAFSKYHVTQKALEYGGLIAKQLSRSQLLGSLKTVFAQTGQAPLIAAELGVDNALIGVRQTFSKEMETLFEKSDFLVSNKMAGNQSPFSADTMKRMMNKGERVAGWGMDAAAAASAKATWAGAYAKVTKEGLIGKAAMQEADRITGKIVGNRTAGLRPSLYESRALQPLAMYTLDINQMYQATKGYIGEKNYKALGTLVAGAFAYNLLYQQLTGDKLLADPIAATRDAGNIMFGDDFKDSEGNDIGFLERTLRAGGRLAGEAAAGTPLGNVAAGSLYPEQGFKIPFSGGDRVLSRADMFGDSQLGRFGGSAPITSAFDNPLNLLGIPGSNQAQRSFEGISAYNEGESTSPSGRQRFTVDQDLDNFIRALLYGQYSTREGREYLLERSRNLRGEESN